MKPKHFYREVINLKLKHLWLLLLMLMLILFELTGCTTQTKQVISPSSAAVEIKHTPEKFLELNNLKVKGDVTKLAVTVPKDWQIKLGEYPEGLYWALANEYSKDAGLDISLLKGKSLEAWIYELADGLPGQGSQSIYTYPSNVVLLVNDNHVVGAWLAFNQFNIGPSVKHKYLEDLTGLSYEQWFYKQKILVETEENKDLAAMDPVQVLDAFCKAITAGDAARVNACMGNEYMLDALTMNLQGNSLFNKDYKPNNSFNGNLLEAKLLSYKLISIENDKLTEIDSIGARTTIIIEAVMKLKWKMDGFNTPDGRDLRFAVLKKYDNGWKIEGLGTGP